MIFNYIFNKNNAGRLSAAFAIYFFIGVLISPFYPIENKFKNLSGGNHRDHNAELTNGDIWTLADIIVRISTKPLPDGKGFQNHDLKYLISKTDFRSTTYPEYNQFTFLTPNVFATNFSQTSPRSPPPYL